MANVSRETNSQKNEIKNEKEPKFESVNEVISRIFNDSKSDVGNQLAEDYIKKSDVINDSNFPRPDRTRLFAVANQKGGVGKTTSAVNIAAAFADAGMNILFIDMDPQGNASTAFGISHSVETDSVYDVIEGRKTLEEVIQTCNELPTLDVVPSTINLTAVEIEIADFEDKNLLLRKALNSFLADSEKHYDYVIIDCAPSLGHLVLNALCAVEEILIPVQAEYYALEGLGLLLNSVELVKKEFNPDLHISAMLVTMYDKRTILSRDVYDQVKEYYPDVLLETTIPRAVRISEAPSFGQTAITYDPKGTGTLAYKQAALEIANKYEQNNS